VPASVVLDEEDVLAVLLVDDAPLVLADVVVLPPLVTLDAVELAVSDDALDAVELAVSPVLVEGDAVVDELADSEEPLDALLDAVAEGDDSVEDEAPPPLLDAPLLEAPSPRPPELPSLAPSCPASTGATY
jgi:hypothetical protein